MEVVGYLHNADFLLEDEHGVAIICGSSYVLSLGDKVYIQNAIDEQAKLFSVKISFATAEHQMLHEDQIQLKFEGCRATLEQYIQSSTVH